MFSRICCSFKCDVRFGAWMAARPYFMNLNEVTCDGWEFLVFRRGENSVLWLPNWSNLIHIHLFPTRPESFLNQTFIGTWCPSKMSTMCTGHHSASAIYVNTSEMFVYLWGCPEDWGRILIIQGEDCGCYRRHKFQISPHTVDWFPTAQHMHIGNPPPP